MIGIALTMMLVVSVGSLPFTLWETEGDGVPRVDEWVYAIYFILYLTSMSTAFFAGMYSSFDPPVAPKTHFGWVHTWRARVPAIFCTLFGTVGVVTLVPLQYSPVFLAVVVSSDVGFGMIERTTDQILIPAELSSRTHKNDR